MDVGDGSLHDAYATAAGMPFFTAGLQVIADLRGADEGPQVCCNSSSSSGRGHGCCAVSAAVATAHHLGS